MPDTRRRHALLAPSMLLCTLIAVSGCARGGNTTHTASARATAVHVCTLLLLASVLWAGVTRAA